MIEKYIQLLGLEAQSFLSYSCFIQIQLNIAGTEASGDAQKHTYILFLELMVTNCKKKRRIRRNKKK